MGAAATYSLPPGPPQPRFLQTLAWIARPYPFMERCRDRYGDMFTLKVASEGTWVFLSDPEHVKQVFTGDPQLLHAGEANVVLLPIVGKNSVLLLDEKAHITQRKLMLPSFHGERMQRYGDLMTEITRDEIARWPTGERFAIWPRMQAVTLEVIMRAVFGIQQADRLTELRGRLRHMLDWTTQPLRMLPLATLGPVRVERIGLFKKAKKPVDEMLLEEIRHRRDDPTLAERDDILSLLVQARHENGEPMSDDELRDELLTLLVAGHETTATALAWAIERLVRHPDKLERLTGEVLAGEDGYLDAVAKETLRLRPVLPIVIRRLTAPMEIGGYLLPPGTGVCPCIYLVHRRPDVYHDPYDFRPERFLEQAAGTYTWIPFGGGIRRCLGASFALFEMKIVLAEVVRSLSLRPARAGREHVSRRAIALTPSRGAEVVATARVPAPDQAELVAA
jgi:cytochrome P450 family 135